MDASARDDFASNLDACSNAAEAWALMTRTAEGLGYASVDYGLARLKAPVPRGPGDIQILHHFATFDWSDHYVERGYQAVDRVTGAALARTTPYAYRELWDRPHESALQREMENEIVDRGIRSGLNVPLHGPGPLFATLGLGSELDDAERDRLERETLPFVYLAAAMFNARMQALLGVDGASTGTLSRREAECLLWAARGKTAWETATILQISESAVKKHYNSAAAKLNARTRTQAVAVAICRGLIAP